MDRTLPGVKDASLVKTKALPDGAASVYSDAFDLGALSGRGIRDVPCDLLLEAPALTTTEAPDTKTFTYEIQTDDDSAFGSPTSIVPSCIVQTGAGGAGAAAASYRFRIPFNAERYIRVKCTAVATCAGSTASMTVSLLF